MVQQGIAGSGRTCRKGSTRRSCVVVWSLAGAFAASGEPSVRDVVGVGVMCALWYVCVVVSPCTFAACAKGAVNVAVGGRSRACRGGSWAVE